MKVFIIVPVYNEGEAFWEWLPGLLEVAGELSAEVVVVDDGSDEKIQNQNFKHKIQGKYEMLNAKCKKSFQVKEDQERDVSTTVDMLKVLRHPVNCGVGSSSLHPHTPQFQLRRTDNLVVLRHPVNCGVGAAIGTGLAYAKSKGADMVLTIDGDGQHEVGDLRLMYLEMIKEGESLGVNPKSNLEAQNPNEIANRKSKMQNSSFTIQNSKFKGLIVNGSRFLKKQKIPFTRRVANFLANLITFGLSGFWVTDSQSGMKGFSKEALEDLEIMTAGYEWCSDVFREANWYGWEVKEVPISVKYTEHSLGKGQNFAVGLDMVVRLVLRSLNR